MKFRYSKKGQASVVMLLIIHRLLRFRELRHLRYYRHDPLVGRLLGLKRLPDVATVSRVLSTVDNKSVNSLTTWPGNYR